jgi:hypothetical protein
VEIKARLQLGAIPGSIRLSWLDRDSLEEFRIHLYGEYGTAILDLRKNKNGVTLYEAINKEKITRVIEGPPVPSTYEHFAAAVKGFSEKGAAAEQDSTLKTEPDFAQGLAVQRAMDMLIIEFNRT